MSAPEGMQYNPRFKYGTFDNIVEGRYIFPDEKRQKVREITDSKIVQVLKKTVTPGLALALGASKVGKYLWGKFKRKNEREEEKTPPPEQNVDDADLCHSGC